VLAFRPNLQESSKDFTSVRNDPRFQLDEFAIVQRAGARQSGFQDFSIDPRLVHRCSPFASRVLRIYTAGVGPMK